MKMFDESAACRKCGGTDISTRYCQRSWHPSTDEIDWQGWRPVEKYDGHENAHIHRHCRRCHYEWAEIPLDALAPADGDTTDATPVRILYTNWRGETAHRLILPRALRYGTSPWHPEPQWLLEAEDVEKSEMRTFAVGEIHDWRAVKA